MLLIVDDDPAFLLKAEKLLDRGEGVYFARNAEHAFDLMASVGADVSAALIDLDLHGEDGFTLIREMRERFPELPLIAISGVFQKNVLESAKVIGAMETLQKPVTVDWTAAIERAKKDVAAQKAGRRPPSIGATIAVFGSPCATRHELSTRVRTSIEQVYARSAEIDRAKLSNEDIAAPAARLREAREECLRAERAYDAHVREHGCARVPPPPDITDMSGETAPDGRAQAAAMD